MMRRAGHRQDRSKSRETTMPGTGGIRGTAEAVTVTTETAMRPGRDGKTGISFLYNTYEFADL